MNILMLVFIPYITLPVSRITVHIVGSDKLHRSRTFKSLLFTKRHACSKLGDFSENNYFEISLLLNTISMTKSI